MENEVAKSTLNGEHNLHYKIKDVHQEIHKKEQELKRLKEKLFYLNCKLVVMNDNSDDNTYNNDNGKDIKCKLLIGFGDEQMRSFML